MAKRLTTKQKALAKGLTPLQKNFAIHLLDPANTQVDAYKKAGGKAKTEQAQRSGASELFRKPEVRAFYDALIDRIADEAILTREQSLISLSNIARSAKYNGDKLAALRQLAIMEGWNAATKHDVEAKVTTTEIVRKIVDPKRN